MTSMRPVVLFVGIVCFALQALYAVAGVPATLVAPGLFACAVQSFGAYLLTEGWDKKASRAHLVLTAMSAPVWAAYFLLGLPTAPVGWLLVATLAMGHAAVLVKHVSNSPCGVPGPQG